MISQAQHYYLSALITSLADLILLVLVYFKATDRRLAQRFCTYVFTIAHWSFFVFLCTSINDKNLSYLLCRICHIGGVFIPITFLHFVSEYTSSKSEFLKYVIRSGYVCVSIIASIIIFFPRIFISDVVPKLSFNFFPSPGPVFFIWNFFFVAFVLIALLTLFRESKKQTESVQKATTYFLAANVLGYAGGIGCFFPVYNISILPFPFGIWGVFFFIFVTAFAVLKYKLIDIEVFIRRTAVFAGLFAFVYGTFTVITVLGQDLFRNFLGWNQWIAMAPTVIIITFALRPLENFLTNITEKFLFQKKYDYRDLLKTFTNEVLTVLDLQKLTEQTVLGLNKIIKLESASILLLDKDTKIYKLATGIGVKDKAQAFAENDAIASYLKETHEPLLRDKSTDEMKGHSSLRDDFKKLNARLCLPIAHHDELIGILSLGMKKSGEEFTQEDIDILATLAKTLAIAIANAQLFDQLSKTQAEAAQREKMAVVGTLAAGINHEICNPLGIVRGQCEMYLLNLRDGLYNQKTKEEMNAVASEIMNKVIKETDRATAITKKLSGFAKPVKKIENEEVNIEKETDEVLGLIGHDLRLNNIEFKKDFSPGFVPIYADRRQMQEVLFNIIRNAAQAMEKDQKDGWIALSGSSVNGSTVIKISDNGSGIPADKLGQIFNPFFTTKEPGKGTGLGLFIVRQVIERNKGTIAVESQEGVGTTFTLTFPALQQAKVLAA